MSLRVKLLPLVFLLPLMACGFEPVYGKKSALPANSPIAQGVHITVDSGGDRLVAEQFRNNLEDLINPTGAPQKPIYTLNSVIRESSTAISVARDGTASRYNLVIESNYTITRIADDKIVGNGTVRNMTSYNNPANLYFSTYVAEQDARKRGLTELAETYRQRLAAFVVNENIDATKIKDNSTIITPVPTYENRFKVN